MPILLIRKRNSIGNLSIPLPRCLYRVRGNALERKPVGAVGNRLPHIVALADQENGVVKFGDGVWSATTLLDKAAGHRLQRKWKRARVVVYFRLFCAEDPQQAMVGNNPNHVVRKRADRLDGQRWPSRRIERV